MYIRLSQESQEIPEEMFVTTDGFTGEKTPIKNPEYLIEVKVMDGTKVARFDIETSDNSKDFEVAATINFEGHEIENGCSLVSLFKLGKYIKVVFKEYDSEYIKGYLNIVEYKEPMNPVFAQDHEEALVMNMEYDRRVLSRGLKELKELKEALCQ
ncbi:MAG: hypothetical protein GY775_09440 [Candidatus Scalindua sp.]|nr:hypothetical protein [Candidatus Scalindua sp.]